MPDYKAFTQKFIFFFLLFFSLIFYISKDITACAPGFSYYYYTPEETDYFHPMIERERLVNSDYGLILSNWGPSYLYPIYLDLIGVELPQDTKDKILEYYLDFDYSDNDISSPIEKWQNASQEITGEKIEIFPDTRLESLFYQFRNCSPNAFETAASTLNKRKEIYSETQLKQWVEKQNEVFSYCNKEISENPQPPEPTKLSLAEKISRLFNKLIKYFKQDLDTGSEELTAEQIFEYDRQYQNAAIEFYKGNYDEARKKFKDISSISSHPWREYSTYLVGRTYLRYASFYGHSWDKEARKYTLTAKGKQEYKLALKEFEKIMNDESLEKVHKPAQEMYYFGLFRTDPKARLKLANDHLLKPNKHNPREIMINIDDFIMIWYENLNKYLKYKNSKYHKVDENDEEQFQEFSNYVLNDAGEFSQWAYLWWKGDKENLPLVLKKYKEKQNSAWLILLSKIIPADHSETENVLSKLQNIPEESPAYITANYYRAKLLKESGQEEKAKNLIDNILNNLDDSYLLTKNFFNDLKMSMANDLNQVISNSYRYPVLYNNAFENVLMDEYTPPENQEENLLLDKKAKTLLNEYTPLDKWMEIIENNEEITDKIKNNLAITAFTRASILQNWELAKRAAKIINNLGLVSNSNLYSFVNANTEENQKLYAAAFLLENPGVGHTLNARLDWNIFGRYTFENRDWVRRNWWCYKEDLKENSIGTGDYYSVEEKIEPKEIKQVLSEEDIEQAKEENKIIYSNVASNYLAKTIIDHTVKYPSDSQNPKNLHLAVDATHYTMCKDKKTTEYSKKAFQLLHNYYPNNYWTNQTPYWY
jgi:hypothetical protein